MGGLVLKADTELIKDLVAKLSIGIVLTDQQGNLIFANEVIKEMSGYSEKEIKTVDDWYKKAYPDQKYRAKIKKLFQYDIEHNINNRTHKIKTAAGEFKFFNFRYSKLLDGKMLYEIIDITEKVEQKKKIRNQKIIFENLFYNSLQAIVLIDDNFKIINVNKQFEKTFKLDKTDILNKYIFNKVFINENYLDIHKEKQKIIENDNWENEVSFIVDNKIKYFKVNSFSLSNKKYGELTYIVLADITKDKENERELKNIKERLELAVDGANIGIWDWDIKEGFIHYDKNWIEMLGYDDSELNNDVKTRLSLIHPDDKKEMLTALRNHLNGKSEEYYNEHRLKTKTNDWLWIRDIGKVTERGANGVAKRAVGVQINIDQEKCIINQIKYLSNHDELTGLYNRRYFNEELKRLHDSHKYPISIIVGDLNRLKNINDNFGHLMGDNYIKSAAEVIDKSIREKDICARVGGDEFAIILPKTNYSTAYKITKRIYENIEEQNSENDFPEPLSIALGCETTDCDNNSQSTMDIKLCYDQADKKMYKEKFASKC